MPTMLDERSIGIYDNDTLLPQPTVPQVGPGRVDGTLPPGYDPIAELGRGGMGVVYKARQRGLNRVVAIKMILSGGHASPAALTRFRTEAEVVGSLEHPNIVQVYESGDYQGLPFFSMEYVPGGTLADRVRDCPLPPKAAAEVASGIAAGVHAAHVLGIIHRDLKPENVLLTGPNCLVPKVMDFGLARHKDALDGLTSTGEVLGTPGYMAPEQAAGAGKSADERTDVYGIGATLYRMLTGRVPFQAASLAEVLMQVMTTDPVAPSRLTASIPADLETICLKCLEKEPARRYASAAELADDLRRFLEAKPVAGRRVTAAGRAWRWARRNPVVATLTGGLAITLLGGSIASTLFAIRAHGWSEAARTELAENQELRQHERETTKKLFLYLRERPELLKSQPCDILDQFRRENPEVPHHTVPGLDE